MPSCPPGCKSSCCAEVASCCSFGFAENPAARWDDLEVSLLGKNVEEAAGAVDAIASRVGKNLETDPELVDLAVSIRLCETQLKEIQRAKETAQKRLDEQHNRKLTCCSSYSYLSVEKALYYVVSPVLYLAAGAGAGLGLYQAQEGDKGIAFTAAAFGLITLEKASGVGKEKIQTAIYRHNHNIMRLRLIIHLATSEIGSAEGLIKIFKAMPTQLKGTGSELDSRVRRVMSGFPEKYRKSFKAERLVNFANRHQTLPASFRHTSQSSKTDLSAVRQALIKEGLVLPAPSQGVAPPSQAELHSVQESQQSVAEPEAAGARFELAVENAGADEGALPFKMHVQEEEKMGESAGAAAARTDEQGDKKHVAQSETQPEPTEEDHAFELELYDEPVATAAVAPESPTASGQSGQAAPLMAAAPPAAEPEPAVRVHSPAVQLSSAVSRSVDEKHADPEPAVRVQVAAKPAEASAEASGACVVM
ncbi:MAG: hypothetical protein HYX48_01960 [Chlamydiales bacterium]|nr:hypothetical protein [Chlamydiales bacterium]